MPGPIAWLVTDYPWAGDPIPGAFHRTAVRALAGHGARLVVAAPVPLTPWPLPRLSRRWAAYAAIPALDRDADGAMEIRRPRWPAVPRLPAWSRPERALAGATLRALDAGERPVLVHSHVAFPAAVAGRIVARELGVPHVVTVHGSDINTWPAAHPRQLPSVVAALREADALVAVSGALAARAEAVCGRRPEVLPIGVDTAALAPARPEERAAARAALGLRDEDMAVAYVGRLTAPKGAGRLVDAMAMAPARARLVLAGDGPLLGHGAGDRVRYLGARGREGVAALLQAADVLVLASDGEGMPTVLVEAGAAGVPVIASAVGGIPELLADGRGTLLADTRPATIAAAIARLADEAKAAATAARALRDHVLEHYDAGTNAGRLLARYRELIGPA